MVPPRALLPVADSEFLASSRPAPDLERDVQVALMSDRTTSGLTLRPGTLVQRGAAVSALATGPGGVVAVQLLLAGDGFRVTTPDLLGPLEQRVTSLSGGRRLLEAWFVWWPEAPPSCELQDDLPGDASDAAQGSSGFLLRFAGGGEVRGMADGTEVRCG